MSAEFSPSLFVPAARVLALGAMGWGIFKSLRGQESLESVTVGSVVGMLGVVFCESYFDLLWTVSQSLEAYVRSAGDGASIFQVLNQSVEDAKASAPIDSEASFGVPADAYSGAIFGAIVQGTVWGTLRLVIEFFFVVLSGALETISLALTEIVKLLFPLAASLYAARPQMLVNLATYAVELSLWSPLLTVVRAVSGYVSKEYISGDLEHRGMPLGLSMIVVQLATIFLFLKIPGFVHSFVAGQLSGDQGVSSPFSLVNTTIAVVAPKVAAARKLGAAAGKPMAVAILLIGATISRGAWAADDRIVLYPGFLTKIQCQGRLLLSAVGNEEIVEKSALPADVGCGLLLRPIASTGRTNLVLETTTGTVRRALDIAKPGTLQPRSGAQVNVGSEP